jgi:predicted DNA-binding transcriptional regulator YafY
VAQSQHHGAIRTFALDGFRTVDWLRQDRFEYPNDYHPWQISEGSFGLFGGKRERIRIFFDQKVARFVRRRQWHPLQRIRKVDRGVVLTMNVAPSVEVISWVLGFGDKARVLEPGQLRAEIASELRRAAAQYE